MKIYSDNNVTKDDLTQMDEIQNKQLLKLRLVIAGVFILNFGISLALRFL